MYTGLKCCIGCNKSGVERARPVVDSLCNLCIEAIKCGYDSIKNDNAKYVMATARWHSLQFGNYANEFGKPLDTAFRNLFDLLSMDKKISSIFRLTEPSATTASSSWILKEDIAFCAKEVVDILLKQQEQLRKKIDCIEEAKKEVVKNERNKIYQDGINKGKSLLLQLNLGEISLEDFDKNQKKY